MLSSLTLTNFALFKKQTIEFESGFNCLLGQSGAGKSIIIDALSFVLGAKADKNFIRSGEASMRVDGVFSDIRKDEKALLDEWEIEGDEILISRTLSQDGKGSIKINGFPVTLKMLQALTEKMADFCGQHDSVGLLNVNEHLALLDKFAGKEVETKLQIIETLYKQLKEIEQNISSLGGSEQQRAREKDLLSFQLNEIESANLDLAEEEELKSRFQFISSSEHIFEKLGDVLLKLNEQRDNVTNLLYDCKGELSGLSEFKEIDECRERLENCYYEVKDVAEVLENIKQSTDFDPKELERIDARLDLIKNLSKKYGKNIEEILAYADSCRTRLEELENGEATLEKLAKERQNKEDALLAESRQLSDIRKRYAQDFESKITKQLEALDMKGTHFKVEFAEGECTSRGLDNVKFMFSANQGQEVKALHKTASGGELSRLLLAFKNVMLDKENVQMVVFDEIDAGISGVTAGKVAEKLVNISKFTQSICITHTPVVASKAGAFILVEKNVKDGETISTARHLNKDDAIYEVARLFDGGKDVSQTAIEHAKKLFN